MAVLANDVQKEWMSLGYGMFIHFGVSTFEGVECGSGSFVPSDFAPSELDIRSWAETAVKAGMKYAVLTAKHVDGFCMWPSQYTEYSVKNSPAKIDIVGEFVKIFREYGLKVGLYYALWDNNSPVYNDDAKYALYMRNQITELLTNYGEIIELWFDGGWNKEFPTKEWIIDKRWLDDPNSGIKFGEVWEWDELYALCHKLQPNCFVVNNTSSDQPGKLRYFPADLAIAERTEYIIDGHVFKPDTSHIFNYYGKEYFIPLEYANTLTPNWFFREGQHLLHPSADTIASWYRLARESNSNLLLNIGPDKRGKFPEYHLDYLYGAAEILGLGK